MNGHRPAIESGGAACLSCQRRSWLLEALSARLEYRGRGENRLVELLALSDEQLIQAVGGRRREELVARHELFGVTDVHAAPGVEAICKHDRRFPRALTGDAAPWLLHVIGGLAALQALASAPTVAIVGSTHASDYGLQMARSLGRGLGASGVTVTSTLSDGIAAAAHAGALEVGAGTIALLGGGVDVGRPARQRDLYERVRRHGCLAAELPCGFAQRRWALRASERIIAGLAMLTVVVEAGERDRDIAPAQLAQAMGRNVAAIPGRVTSPLSAGTNSLLMDGASVVRGPSDVLELLSLPEDRASELPSAELATLPASLRDALEQVGAGRDTPERLIGAGADSADVMVTLTELELRGLLTRGDGGRYVPRHGLARSQHSRGRAR